jgi:flagellar M-ring protein FliF
LQANNVSVVDNQGNVLSENQENDSVAGLSCNQLTARRNIEQYLTKKAEGMLDKVLGPDQAVVRVAVDLNWDTMTRTEEKYDPDSQVATSSTINDEETDSDIASSGGSPGMAANNVAAEGGTNTSAAAQPVNSSRTKKKITTSSYDINKITSSQIQAAGGIKRISGAVFIAQRFEGKGADRKALPRTPKELDDIKSIVKSALGIQENDPARKDEITLEEMPFNDQTATEITQQFEQQNKRQVWFDLAPKLVYPALAIGIIFMFWRMLKNTKVDDIPLGVPIGNGNGGGHYGKPGVPGSGMVTVDVLNQLIRENPANMTSAVRSWMTRASTKPNN